MTSRTSELPRAEVHFLFWQRVWTFFGWLHVLGYTYTLSIGHVLEYTYVIQREAKTYPHR
jgi:hypothetical protein